MAGEPTLKRGHNNPHDWVVHAQQLINHALAGGMHLDIPENGVFDEEMEKEVSAFQERHGLAVDGEIGPNTWAALQGRVAEKQRAAQADDNEDSQPHSGAYTYSEQRRLEQGHDTDDEVYHQYTDEHGNVVKQYAMSGEGKEATGDPNENGVENTILVDPKAHVDINAVVTQMTEIASRRLGEQIPYTHSAVLQFQTHAHQQIAQFVEEHEPDASIGWGSLVEGLTSGLLLVFAPELEAMKFVFETAASVFSAGLEARLEHATSALNAAEAKLTTGVDTLVAEIDQRWMHAVDAARKQLPAAIGQQMEEYRNQYLTLDKDWIEEMVHWFGFPERTEETVTAPILYELNSRFGELLSQVQAQLTGQ